jgi:hypothetical protein
MIKEPIMISQTYRTSQISALQTLEPAQPTVVEPPIEKGKIRIEGGGDFRHDSLTFWGFFPVVTLAGLIIWEFGFHAAWVLCARYLQCHRKKDTFEHLND